MTPTKLVIVAGAAGFLGQHVCAALNGVGWSVLGVDRVVPAGSGHVSRLSYYEWVLDDLSNIDKVAALLQRTKPVAWIHLAGPASVSASFENPTRELEASILPLARVLEAIRRTSPETRLLLSSSAAVYGEPESLPISESQALRPISPYGFHKLHQELLLDEYHCLYGMRVCKARIFSTYGPGTKQLAVWEITGRGLAGDFSALGDGEESRDYLYVEDVAEAFLCICERSAFTAEAINVASGEEMRIADLTRAIYSALGTPMNPEFCGELRPGNPRRWRADVSRLQALSFLPRVGMEEGLRRTVSWIRTHA